MKKIQPDPGNCNQSQAERNVGKYLKVYSEEDLTKAINNYDTVTKDRESTYKKAPNNFFGVQGDSKEFFKQFLPENFKPIHTASTSAIKDCAVCGKPGKFEISGKSFCSDDCYDKRDNLFAGVGRG